MNDVAECKETLGPTAVERIGAIRVILKGCAEGLEQMVGPLAKEKRLEDKESSWLIDRINGGLYDLYEISEDISRQLGRLRDGLGYD